MFLSRPNHQNVTDEADSDGNDRASGGTSLIGNESNALVGPRSAVGGWVKRITLRQKGENTGVVVTIPASWEKLRETAKSRLQFPFKPERVENGLGDRICDLDVVRDGDILYCVSPKETVRVALRFKTGRELPAMELPRYWSVSELYEHVQKIECTTIDNLIYNGKGLPRTSSKTLDDCDVEISTLHGKSNFE